MDWDRYLIDGGIDRVWFTLQLQNQFLMFFNWGHSVTNFCAVVLGSYFILLIGEPSFLGSEETKQHSQI